MEKLTARSTATVTVSEKALTAWVDGGGGWREKECTGEVESEELKVKSRKSRYLRHRWVTAELRDTLGWGLRSGTRDSLAAVASSSAEGKNGDEGGSARCFIDGRHLR